MSKNHKDQGEKIYPITYPGQTTGPYISQITRSAGNTHTTKPNHGNSQSSHPGFRTIYTFEYIRSAMHIVLIMRHITCVTISQVRIEFR